MFNLKFRTPRYEPLNSSIGFAVGHNESIAKYWTKSGTSKVSVLTIPNELLKPHMFYYSTDKDGYYELYSEHGNYRSGHTKDVYLERKARHESMSLVFMGKRLRFAVFHSDLSDREIERLVIEHSKDRDAQRMRMYRWQHAYDQFFPHLREPLDNKRVRNLVLNILDDYSVDLSRIDFREDWNARNKRAIAVHYTLIESALDLENFCMMIYRFNCTSLSTVLHEVAHSLVNTEYCSWKGAVAAHGPEFCLILAELFSRYAGIKFMDVYTSMKNARLKVDHYSNFFNGKTYGAE